MTFARIGDDAEASAGKKRTNPTESTTDSTIQDAIEKRLKILEEATIESGACMRRLLDENTALRAELQKLREQRQTPAHTETSATEISALRSTIGHLQLELSAATHLYTTLRSHVADTRVHLNTAINYFNSQTMRLSNEATRLAELIISLQQRLPAQQSATTSNNTSTEQAVSGLPSSIHSFLPPPSTMKKNRHPSRSSVPIVSSVPVISSVPVATIQLPETPEDLAGTELLSGLRHSSNIPKP